MSKHNHNYTDTLKHYAQLTNRSIKDAFNDEEWIKGFMNANFYFAGFSHADWQAYFTLAQYLNSHVNHQAKCLQVLEEYLGPQHQYAIHLRHRILLALQGRQSKLVNIDLIDNVGYQEPNPIVSNLIMRARGNL
jgi:hypothetical protein